MRVIRNMLKCPAKEFAMKMPIPSLIVRMVKKTTFHFKFTIFTKLTTFGKTLLLLTRKRLFNFFFCVFRLASQHEYLHLMRI
jgi:hypothetical protein